MTTNSPLVHLMGAIFSWYDSQTPRGSDVSAAGWSSVCFRGVGPGACGGGRCWARAWSSRGETWGVLWGVCREAQLSVDWSQSLGLVMRDSPKATCRHVTGGLAWNTWTPRWTGRRPDWILSLFLPCFLSVFGKFFFKKKKKLKFCFDFFMFRRYFGWQST